MLTTVIENAEHAPAALNKATAILTGQDNAYSPMEPWNTEGIGNWIRGNMKGVRKEGVAESAVEYALAHLIPHLFERRRHRPRERA